MEENYLDSVKKQFAYYKLLGERTFAQLSDEELFWSYNNDSNAIAVIVNHLWGNMLSRWTDFLTSDGEKEWRQRDLEFARVIKDREELLAKWYAGWECLFTALEAINATNFQQPVYIRNQGHTVVEAINRQLAHYAYHIGQIVFVGKMCRGDGWESLSIPKGQSAAFNRQKFAQKKGRGHFTDGIIDDGK